MIWTGVFSEVPTKRRKEGSSSDCRQTIIAWLALGRNVNLFARRDGRVIRVSA